MKCASDAILCRRLAGRLPNLGEVLMMPLKDLAMAFIWLVGCVRRRVVWRGNELRIERGSLLTSPESHAMEAARELA